MRIQATDPRLSYSGRIAFEDGKAIFVYPATYVKIRFCGKNIRALVDNNSQYWDNYVGVFVDGVQTKIRLENDATKIQNLVLAENLAEEAHEVMLFKRQDACHEMGFYGFEMEEAVILPAEEKPKRKIEVYGDSVSAGEVSEALAYVGKEDPEWHCGELSNSYYSYAWTLARRLEAQLHDIAQGGIALLDGTGWYDAPNYMGMESVYGMVRYNRAFGSPIPWDFSKYTPNVVIVAIGQNDNHPTDYMATDKDGAAAERWKQHYESFVERLANIYPNAQIVLCTTILQHHQNWDLAIEEICRKMNHPRVHHFLFEANGCGTPGHIRRPEAEQMALELAVYLEGLNIEGW